MFFFFISYLQRKPLKPLREAIPNFVLRSNSPSMTAIDTSDVPEWFRFNSTYSFLHQISPNASNVSLPFFFFLFLSE